MHFARMTRKVERHKRDVTHKTHNRDLWNEFETIYLERERERTEMKDWLRTKPWKSQGTMLHFEEIQKASEMEPKRSTCVIQEYKRYK